jgi:uncharacterized protein (DUF58 family)
MIKLLKGLYFNNKFYLTTIAVVGLFVLGFFFDTVFMLAGISLLALIVVVLADIITLFVPKNPINAHRKSMEKMSNGDENHIHLNVESKYPFIVDLSIIDEVPFQFQIRDFDKRKSLSKGESVSIKYKLRPVERGEYHFGNINVLAKSKIGLVSRRLIFDAKEMIPVYPSFLQLRKFEFLAISNKLTEIGVKKVRRIGNTLEFEHIRNYVVGDDYRALNWKATARRGEPMVNQYQDEVSQNVFSIIDMGRVMKMPFKGMTLLDYSINAALVLSNIALIKSDKAGLVTFSKNIKALVPPKRKRSHINAINETLYNQKTDFSETDYHALYTAIRRKIKQRSLLLLFTNFDTLSGMERNIEYFRAIAKKHLLVVIFFVNTELYDLINSEGDSVKDIYNKTIAEKLAYEKREIIKKLEQYHIHTIYTRPENLTVDTINKYLEIKSRRML